jgi:dihydroorotate dehydrogenase
MAGATGFVAGSSLSSHSRDLLPGVALPWPERRGPHPVKFGAFSGPELRDVNLAMVATLRRLAPDAIIIASGGIHEKSDLEDYLGAGADLFQIHTALARGGPQAVARLIQADGEIGSRETALQAAE